MKPPRCQHCEERADRVLYFGRRGPHVMRAFVMVEKWSRGDVGAARGWPDGPGPRFMYVCRAHFETYEALEALKR